MVKWKHIPIREEYYEQLKKQAKLVNRSVSNYLETILIEKGIISPIKEKTSDAM